MERTGAMRIILDNHTWQAPPALNPKPSMCLFVHIYICIYIYILLYTVSYRYVR